MKRNVSVVRLIVVTRSSGSPASGKIIAEMPGSVASGTSYIITIANTEMCCTCCYCSVYVFIVLCNTPEVLSFVMLQ